MSVKVHEAFSIDSFQDRLLWWDDFLGDQLKDEWTATTGATGTVAVVDAQTGGIVRLNCPAAADSARIWWNNIRSLLVTKKLTVEFRALLFSTADSRALLVFRFDGSNEVGFEYDTNTGDTNWTAHCVDGGAPTEIDTGIAPDTSYHIFRFECHTHGSNHVHFYIDGVEVANSPITTNIPDDAADYLQPLFFFQAVAPGVNKGIDIDYVVVRQEI